MASKTTENSQGHVLETHIFVISTSPPCSLLTLCTSTLPPTETQLPTVAMPPPLGTLSLHQHYGENSGSLTLGLCTPFSRKPPLIGQAGSGDFLNSPSQHYLTKLQLPICLPFTQNIIITIFYQPS